MRCGEYTLEPAFSAFVLLLKTNSHADAVVRVHEREMLECAGHGKNFGTKLHAVENRARRLFGLHSGDDYPRHKYERGEGYP